MFEPLPASQWNATTAAHLMNRAGFGGSPADIENLRRMGLEGAVSWLLDYDKIPDDTPAPDWAHPIPTRCWWPTTRRSAMRPMKIRKRELREDQDRLIYKQMADLRYWWLRRMALGPRPFQEKMTLFWHGHFATSFEKVRNALFSLAAKTRRCARTPRANFPSCSSPCPKDPAMLDYLDGAQQPKGQAEREFRPRSDGALHPRRGPLHRAGHPAGGQGLHRLGPRQEPAPLPVPSRQSR